MRNVTITMNDEAYRKARVWAAEHDTNISAAVKYILDRLPRLSVAQQGFPLKTPSATQATPSATPPAAQ